MYSIPKQAKTLFDLYLFHQSTSSYHRSELSKKVTAYNKANPTNRISSGMLIKERFPTLFNYVKALYPTTPEEDLFENNFKKLITNLNILPSEKTRTSSYNQKTYKTYESLTPQFVSSAYSKMPVTLANSITGKTYELSGHLFKSTDSEDSFYHGDLQYVLAVIRES